MKNSTNEKIKKSKKQLAYQVVLIVILVFAGIASGFYCGNLYLSTKYKSIDYSKLNESDFLPNFEEILKKNNGKTIDQVSPIDAFIIAQYNLDNCEMFSAISQGNLTHNYGKQSVYTYRYKYNGIQLTEEISTSKMKSVAKKTKYENNIVYVYNGDTSSSSTAVWADSFTKYTYDEYKQAVGVYPDSNIAFIVSDKTVNPSDTKALVAGSGTKLTNGNMRFTILLNKENAVMNYVKKIQYMSELSDCPTFSTIEITFEIDKNFNFVSITSNEIYSFKYLGGIFVTCSGSITTTYDFNNIPTQL